MTQYSYLKTGKAGQTISEVTRGIGTMLPSIAATVATGGVAGPALLGGGTTTATAMASAAASQAIPQAVGMGTFMAGAAGQSFDEAIREGANYDSALAYGVTSGLVEGAVEKISGGLGGTKPGQILGKQLGKSTFGKMATTFAGEGAEEVASDLVNPLLRQITGVNTWEDTKQQYKDLPEQLPHTFLVGGLTGTVMGGAGRAIEAHEAGGFKNLNAQEGMQGLYETQKKRQALAQNGLLNSQSQTRVGKDIRYYQDRVSKALKGMEPTKRKAFLEANKLTGAFNEAGEPLARPNTWVTADEALKADSAPYNAKAYSIELAGKENDLAYKPTKTALTEAEFAAAEGVAKLSKGKVKIVITDEITAQDGRRANGVYRDGILYISRKADVVRTAGIHELIHTTEGTAAYDRLKSYVFDSLKKNPELSKKYGDVEARLAELSALYSGVNTGLSENTKRYEAETEFMANFLSEEVLSSEAAIERLVRSDRNLAERIYDFIKAKLKALTSRGAERASLTFYDKTERLLGRALDKSVGGVTLAEVEGKNSQNSVLAAQYSKKLGGYNPEINAKTEGIKEYFKLESISNIAHVIKKVTEKLKNSYLSTETQIKPITNIDTGINITIWKSGISETFGKPEYYGKMSKEMKLAKLASMEHLAKLIKYGEVRAKEAKNYHNPKSNITFAYLKSPINIDGQAYMVTMDIRRYPTGENKFYIHDLQINKKEAGGDDLAKKLPRLIPASASTTSISQNTEKSTENSKKVEDTPRYSIAQVNGGRKAVIIEEDILAGVDKADYAKTVREAMQKFSGGIPVSNGRLIKVNAITRNEYVNSKNTQYYKGSDDTLYKDKMTSGGNLDEIVLASDDYINEGLNHPRKDSFKEFARGNVLLNIAERQYSAKVIVGYTGKDAVLYDVVDFKPTKFEVTKKDVVKANSENRDTFEATTSSTTSISQNGEKSTENDKKDNGGRYSLVRDSAGRELTKEQAEFFKDSKVVDSEGRLLEVYHGTSAREIVSRKWNADHSNIDTKYKDFTEFKQDPENENIGFFFASDYDNAGGYGNRVYNVYLNLTNPLVIDCNNADYSVIRYNGEIKDTYDWAKWAKSNGYDGVIFKNIRDGVGYEYMQESLDEYVAFYSNQIKQVTNTTPTTNRDIRYSLPLTGNGMKGQKPVAKVLTEVETRNKTVKEKAKESYETTQIKLTNAQAGIEHAAKRLGATDMEAKTHAARAARNMAEEMLFGEQYSRDMKKAGKGLQAIFKPVYDAAKKNPEYKQDFFDYLMHMHNVDRMKVNKPVFAETVTAEQSRAEAAKLLNAHPEFQSIAEEVWKYNDNLLQYRVDSGLTLASEAEELRNRYPHYVPTYRDQLIPIGTGSLKGKYNFAVTDTIKTAKGGSADILPPDVIMARQTVQVVKTSRVNDVGLALWEGAERAKSFEDIEIIAREKLTDLEPDYEDFEPKNNEVTLFKDGEKVTMRVTPEVFEGFKAFAPADPGVENILVKGTRKVISVFKKLVTEYNPFFTGRNFLRDLQEALIYTKHPTAKFTGAMLRAARQIKNNGELWRKYKAMGGESSSMFDFNKGVNTEPSKVEKILTAPLTAISKANGFIEQLPRVAEFILSVEAGKSYEQALLDSAEVTTNFSRAGTATKFLNSTLIPFLNPSVQGFSKLWRTVTGRKTGKEWLSSIIRALILGIGVSALNDLLMGDDEDYAALSQRDKDNNYLIKVGDTFLKLPKGRVNGVLGSIYLHGKNVARGEQNPWEAIKEWGSSAKSNLTPADSLTRTIFSPFSDMANNRTWYGGEIESRKFDNTAPSDRYDESTSSIAVKLGKLLNYSPKKLHYLIDQYSGIVGDLILPLTTKKAERNVFAYNFTVDPILQNRYASDFYDTLDKLNYARTAGDLEAAAKVRFLNSVAGEVSDMYRQKQEIEKSDASDKDKSAESKAVQALINASQKEALTRLKDLDKALAGVNLAGQLTRMQRTRDYAGLTDSQQAAADKKLFDYLYSIATAKALGDDTGEKQSLYAQLPTEKLFVWLTALSAVEPDKTPSGETVTGSRKQKVIAYIEALPLTAKQKYALLELAGYKTDNKV